MRLVTAFTYFFKILFQGEQKALQLLTCSDKQSKPIDAEQQRPEFQYSHSPAVQVLNLFQSNGRLIDFLKEDISQYEDADIGAAVRDIHAGCQQVLDKNFELTSVFNKNQEGQAISVNSEFDPSKIELVGNLSANTVAGSGVQGTLVHAGWIVEAIKLPTIAKGQNDRVVAPAQVEV
ncbi:hypothetical protein C2869_14405 [Saccharobesus litoralis]|uniref:DUF2760 domain-containing protein n=1 Tax=Saccharobesus litoralis TaxID=2172099 RepID=A0A2S0VTM3_9ALTE|nr:DUF2760 domain-containing protein [Saccharobesus litoralis]AWB67557.1 hypothetical protein C2869_14405 [Saccharobesus litoralis]